MLDLDISLNLAGQLPHDSPSQPVFDTEDYQTALYKKDLDKLLNVEKKVKNNIIDAYLNVLTTHDGNNATGKFGVIPSYVVFYFHKEGIFEQEWFDGIKREVINSLNKCEQTK
jgi:hypothetical protein